MKPCFCEKYLSPLTTFDEVQGRCAVSGELLPFFERVAVDSRKWVSVYRCRICGTFWAEEYPYGEMHGGGPSCLYIIETHNPEAWLEAADNLTSKIRQRHEDERFYESLGPELGPELCKHEACGRKRIALSVMCRCHHFEMVRQQPCPFW